MDFIMLVNVVGYFDRLTTLTQLGLATFFPGKRDNLGKAEGIGLFFASASNWDFKTMRAEFQWGNTTDSVLNESQRI
jgi:hypothetical protein